jgi:chemotaxis regulatin CheY-phosphate phosphatase CheZ
MANDELLTAIQTLSNRFETFETFTKRRFDEISMEVNATSQLMDMAEEGMSSRLGEMLGALEAISFHGDGETSSNSGVELDAVISITEKAADSIMDATDRIAAKLEDPEDSKDPKIARIAASISEDLNEILLACSFQDLTSQRINNTIDNLKVVEDRISSTLTKIGIEVPDRENQTPDSVNEAHKTNNQDSIDALFD